ncbi:hypothetical protein L4X63_19945 [Geomonas sp. Red32]|uniref:hypothetical protein n=1 Tax=Geomonas sp. Red32 TaxID=2912856 RepID=UPI00202CD61D|nr:hypothetical protein [Geomonas sp. Red32]MCM0083861.1 hypothetical protein [Geomonas sp. Red32]
MRTNFRLLVLVALVLMALAPRTLLAAVGCDLNDPDRDVYRLYPGATSYKTVYTSIYKAGGAPLLKKIEARLGEKYLSLYAPVDLPFTIYEVYQGAKKVGFVHGVNQKGQFGGIQVFVALDLSGKIKTFYIQKISGPSAGKLREAGFAKKFAGVSLKDFGSFDPATGKGHGRLAELKNPAQGDTDFYGVLRGLKKNLVLMDELGYTGKGVGK